MSAEDKLRALLREESTTIVPTGDGLARIQERVARKRRLRVWLLPSAALATAAATAAFLVLGPSTGPTTLTQQPGASPTGTGFCYPPIAEGGCPSSAPAPQAMEGPYYEGPSIWPFTSVPEARAWQTTAPWADDKQGLVRRFATDLLGLTSVTTATTCESCDVVELRVGGARVGDVSLGRYTFGRDQVYTVISVDGGDLTITRPAAGATITSPTSVSGRIMGVDENVQLRLITKAGKEISQAGAPAGTEVPWQGSLSWTDTSWTHGAIVATTGSPKDGALNRLAVLAVVQATGATAGPSFVGLVDGHVSLFDATTGESLKQLTFPAGGEADTGAAWSVGSLLWVRSSQTGCSDELNRLDNGTASTVVKAGTAHLGTPQLSPSAGWLAYVSTPCAGGASAIIVSGGGAPDRALAVPNGMVAAVLDVRDDGALLVHLNGVAASEPGTIGVVPPGALSLADMSALTPTGSCYLAGGAAFEKTTPVAFETCFADSRLVHFTDQGARTSVDPPVTGMAAPRSTTASAGELLVWLKEGAVARYDKGTLTTLARSGVQAPDW